MYILISFDMNSFLSYLSFTKAQSKIGSARGNMSGTGVTLSVTLSSTKLSFEKEVEYPSSRNHSKNNFDRIQILWWCLIIYEF